MARATKRYRKLARTGGLIAYYSLWQDKDHLLAAETTMASEDYRRFYYREIQAITVQKTGMHHIYSVLFGLPAAATLVLGIFGDGLRPLWLTLGALTGLMLAINLWRGPTCVCHIRTAVQQVRIRAVVRLRRLERILDQIRPLITEAQADLKIDAPPPPASKVQPVADQGPDHPQHRPAPPASIAPVSSRRHQLLFGGLVIQALLAGTGFFVSNLVYGMVEALLALAVMVVTVAALARQADSGLPPMVKRLTWAGLGLVCFEVAAGYAASFWSFTTNPELVGTQWALFKHILMLSPHDYPLLMGAELLILTMALSVGLGGLVSLRTSRGGDSTVPDRSPLPQATA